MQHWREHKLAAPNGVSQEEEFMEKRFDKEAVHDAEISPLMDKIIAICKREGIPMVAAFCYAKGRHQDDPEGVSICTTHLGDGDGYLCPEFVEAVTIIKREYRPPGVVATTMRYKTAGGQRT